MLARKIDGSDHIGRLGASSDQRRPLVDQAVPDPACLLLVGILRLDQLAAKGTSEPVHRALFQSDPSFRRVLNLLGMHRRASHGPP